ncbi:MAG: hypothetical protein IT580_21865, partial [Verrucomicrobiales bacterium]|nr:hypothetical protein [Verrucomicrobiales bacterium]
RPAADAELPPAEITGLSPAQVAAGAYHTLVLRTDGSVTGFGRNDQRQLGIALRASDTDAAGTSTQPGVDFATVPLPRPAVAVAAGAYHSAALLDDGTVWTWGRNKEGQLGRAEIFDPGAAGQVPGLPRIRTLAASALSTLAIDENGALWLWGQLDPDSFETRRLPGQILDVTGALTVVAGRTHALVTAEGGTAFAFGNSDYAQLGHGEEFSVQAVFPELELIYQPIYTYVTNVVLAEEVRMEHSTREVIDWVPIVQWWQRHALTVVDYAAGGTAPEVRPTLAFPGELRGVSNGGEVLFSVAQKLEGTTNIVSREVLEVSGYDGVTVFVGDSLTLSTNSEVTSFVNVKADGHVLLSQGAWNNPSASRLRVLELAGARLNQIAEVPLLSGPQETQLLDQTLMVRGAGTLELWDLTSPAAPRAIPAVDHGCVWFSLRDAEGSADTGWWVPGGEYGTLRLAPR